MSNIQQVLSKEGVYGVAVAPNGVVRIDPQLRAGTGQRLGLDEVDVSGAFLVININDNPALPEYGTFDAQNISNAPATLRWTATFQQSIQYNPSQPIQTTFGTNGADPSPFPPVTIAGGGGEANTASNLGALGSDGLFAAKVGVDLQFKSLRAGANITLTPSPTEVLIDAAGGGGGVDIHPNRVTIGNAQAGDTLSVCDLLWDNTSLPSIVAVAATIGAALSGFEFFFRQGNYVVPPTVVMTIPSGVKISGAGVRSTIFVLGTDPFLAGGQTWSNFSLGSGATEESELRDFGVDLDYSGLTIAGLCALTMGPKAIARNLLFFTTGVPVLNDTTVESVIGTFGGATEIQILDCVFDCAFNRTDLVAPLTGISAIGGPTSGSDFTDATIRSVVQNCDHGFMISGERCKMDIQIIAARNVGYSIGSRHDLTIQAGITQSVILDTEPALTLHSGNNLRVSGNIYLLEPVLGATKLGIVVGGAGVEIFDSHISCSTYGFSEGVRLNSVCARNTISDSTHVMDTGFMGFACIVLGGGASRNTINGNTVNSQNGGILVSEACEYNSIVGNIIDMPIGGPFGIQLLGTATKNTVTGNTIYVGGGGGIGIDIQAGAGSDLQVISSNTILAGVPISNAPPILPANVIGNV